MVYNWLNITQHWLMPVRCPLCLVSTQSRQPICQNCYRELPWLAPDCKSGEILLPANLVPALDDCHALLEYRPPVDHWIQQLKFHHDLTLAKMLGQLLAGHIPAGKGTKLIPVPLHRRRLRQRGFNQALEIARPLQQQGYRIDSRSCSRPRFTPPQSELPAQVRLYNLRNAFEVRDSMAGKKIVLVDDVLTTGATLNALADALRKAGATWVEAWVIARTPEPGMR